MPAKERFKTKYPGVRVTHVSPPVVRRWMGG
jgi:hypothetical protein